MTSLLPVTRRGPLDPAAVAEIRSLATEAAAADGVAPLSENPLLHLTADAGTVHLLVRAPRDGTDLEDAANPDGALAGYAQLDLGAPGSATAEMVVAPRFRRRGVGRVLLEAARELAAQDGAGSPDGRQFSVWAHGDLPAARAFAASAGLAVVRELLFLSLDLATLPADEGAPTPRGVSVRAFVRGQDEDEWRRANARAFAHHPEQGRITRQDLDARMAEPWFDPAGFLLAERDGVLLGSVWTKVHPADATHEAAGEIYVVGVDPDAQGLGLGGALIRQGLEHLAGRGIGTAILYCEADNEIALRAYARLGFARAGVDVQFG